MSRIHRLRPRAMFATALALFTLALALSPAGGARAATTTVTYTLATATATPVTAACDIPPCPVISYTFAGPGTTASGTVPASGSFTWTFTPSKSSNSNSCAFTQGTGTLDVTWADLTTTEVTFAFKARDSHSWALKGQVTAGSTPSTRRARLPRPPGWRASRRTRVPAGPWPQPSASPRPPPSSHSPAHAAGQPRPPPPSRGWGAVPGRDPAQLPASHSQRGRQIHLQTGSLRYPLATRSALWNPWNPWNRTSCSSTPPGPSRWEPSTKSMGHYLQTQAPTADFSPDWTHVVAVGPHILFVRNDGLFAVGHIDQKTGHYVETDGAAGAFSSPLFSPGLDPHRGGGRGWDEHGWQRGLCCRRGATAMTKPAGQVPARVAGLWR